MFINLGKVLLEEGAVQAAVQAFDLINDITGLVNVDQTKADLFDESGYPEESLNWYTRALNVSRDDLDLLAKTAMLREARGQADVANALYFRAIGNVLRTLDTKRRQERPGANASPMALLGYGPDTSVTRDYRTYFEFLAQGFLATWPNDPKTAGERIDAIRTMFDTELSVVLDDPSWQPDEADPTAKTLTIDEFTRLDRVARLARRIAERASDLRLGGHLDASLGEHFPDPTAVAAEVADLPLLRRHMEIAKRNDDYEAAVRLARLAGDDEDLLALFRNRIDKGSYREGLAYARSLLDPSTFKRLVAAIATTLKDNTKSFLELVQADPDLVLEIESDLGRDIVTVEELFTILAAPAAEAGPGIYLGPSDGVWEYLKAKASVDDQLRHLASTAARHRRGDFRSFAFSSIFHDLLTVELSAPQREALIAAASEYLEKLDLKSEYEQSSVFELLLVPQAHPANRDALYELAAEAQRLAQMAVDVGATLPRILEGTDEEAFLALVEIQRTGQRYFGAVSGRDARYAPVRARILESARRGEAAHDAETVRIVYELEFSNRYYGVQPPREKMERQADLLPILVERYPDDQRYLRELVAARLGLARWDEAEEALAGCYESDPTDEILRAALYYLLTYRDRYEAALSLVTDGGPDLREQSTLDGLLEKVRTARGFEASSSASLFRTIYRGPLEPSYNRFSPQVDRAIDTLRDLATTEDVAPEDETTQALRTVWRGATAPDPEYGFYRPDGYLVNSILSLPLTPDSSDPYYYGGTESDYRLDALLGDDWKTDSATLFEALASVPGSAAEFDIYLHALPDGQRRGQHRLYRLLTESIKASGTLDQRVEALSEELPELGDHDFTVWMLLRHEQAVDVVRSEREAFVERLAKVEDPSTLQILAIARLHAKAQAYEEASQHYRLLTAKLARHGEFIDQRRVVVSGYPDEPLLDLSELAREVATTLPSELARATAESIVAAARRADRHDAFDAYFDTFLLRALAYLHDPKEALSQAARISRSATSVEVPLGEWDVPKAVELVRLHAMIGDEARAIELLRGVLGTTGHDADPGYPLAGPLQQDRYELVSALNALAGLYGLRRLDLYDGTPAPLHDLILRRERPFPADSAHHFPGDVAWMTTAADALVSWLDHADLDRASVLEAAFVVAWQLHSRGEDDRAKAVVASLADKITTDPKRLGLDHLVLMALRVGNALPPDLAAEALAQGNLRLEQEVELIEGLQRANDPATALRVGRRADRGDKLALMRVLAPLALAAGDADYVTSLENRIDAAEQARRGLGLDESA